MASGQHGKFFGTEPKWIFQRITPELKRRIDETIEYSGIRDEFSDCAGIVDFARLLDKLIWPLLYGLQKLAPEFVPHFRYYQPSANTYELHFLFPLATDKYGVADDIWIFIGAGSSGLDFPVKT